MDTGLHVHVFVLVWFLYNKTRILLIHWLNFISFLKCNDASLRYLRKLIFVLPTTTINMHKWYIPKIRSGGIQKFIFDLT